MTHLRQFFLGTITYCAHGVSNAPALPDEKLPIHFSHTFQARTRFFLLPELCTGLPLYNSLPPPNWGTAAPCVLQETIRSTWGHVPRSSSGFFPPLSRFVILPLFDHLDERVDKIVVPRFHADGVSFAPFSLLPPYRGFTAVSELAPTLSEKFPRPVRSNKHGDFPPWGFQELSYKEGFSRF